MNDINKTFEKIFGQESPQSRRKPKRCITKKELKNIGKKAKKKYLADDGSIIGDCEKASRYINNELRKKNIQNKITRGMLRKSPLSRTSIHFWVELDGNQVKDKPGKVIILDPTLDQYNTKNFRGGKVDLDLGPKSSLPNIAIVSPGDKEFSFYMRPFGR